MKCLTFICSQAYDTMIMKNWNLGWRVSKWNWIVVEDLRVACTRIQIHTKCDIKKWIADFVATIESHK